MAFNLAIAQADLRAGIDNLVIQPLVISISNSGGSGYVSDVQTYTGGGQETDTDSGDYAGTARNVR